VVVAPSSRENTGRLSLSRSPIIQPGRPRAGPERDSGLCLGAVEKRSRAASAWPGPRSAAEITAVQVEVDALFTVLHYIKDPIIVYIQHYYHRCFYCEHKGK